MCVEGEVEMEGERKGKEEEREARGERTECFDSQNGRLTMLSHVRKVGAVKTGREGSKEHFGYS